MPPGAEAPCGESGTERWSGPACGMSAPGALVGPDDGGTWWGYRCSEISPSDDQSVLEYAALGWACVPGAHPLRKGGRACSCDRLGCPDPGRATRCRRPGRSRPRPTRRSSPRWWERDPEANVILPTGRVFDVFDVPLAAGCARCRGMDAAGFQVGPVADERRPGPFLRRDPGRARGRGRVVVLSASTATRRPSTTSRGCAGTAATATCSPRRRRCRRPAR